MSCFKIHYRYLHSHPLNGIFPGLGKKGIHGCYPEVNDLATNGLRLTIPFDEKDKCQNKATAYAQKHSKYSHYSEDVLERKKEIFVLRAEHFWDDWQNINYMLGGGKITKVDSVTHYECSTPVVTNRTVSEEGIRNLCYHLCGDIQWYKRLILSAVNLNEEDKSISLKELEKTCPVEARSTICPIEDVK